MADFHTIAAVGRSIERRLNDGYIAINPVGTSTRAVLAQTEDLAAAGTTGSSLDRPCLSILLYRVDVTAAHRAGLSASRDPRRLPLDLWYLLTPWANNAEDEHAILGRTLQILDETPSLTGPLLHPSAAWGPDESVQLRLVDLELRDVVETFESLPVDFRISVSYTASSVRIDTPVGLGEGHVDRAFIGISPTVPQPA